MHQRSKSIASHALFLLGVLTALQGHVSAQPGRIETVPQIAYSAPAACPTASEFERRLRARLSKPAALSPLGFSIRLTVHEARTRGELQVRGAAQARRTVEAASCDEAVAALTLIAALLIEPAHAGTPAPREPSSRRPRRAPRASSPGSEATNAPATRQPAPAPRAATAERPTRAADASEQPQSASPQQPAEQRQPASSPQPTSPARPAGAAQPAGARQPAARPASPPQPSEQPQPASLPQARRPAEEPADARPPQVAGPPPRASEAAPQPARQRASARLVPAFELAAAALLAHGTLPALRPGLSLRGSLALARPGHGLGAALELGARGLLPHLARSPQGDAHFSFYAGTGALCASYRAAERARGALSGSACALAELGRLAAEGRATEQPRRVHARFAALGPALRASLALTPQSSLILGTELLFPLVRDRFQLADTRLFRVPRLTIRLELGFGVRFE